MYLAGDIGGTKTHLALHSDDKLIKEKKFPSKDYKDLETIISEFLEGTDAKDLLACFGIAGPVVAEHCELTNLSWALDAKEIKNKLGFQKVALLNDLETNAYGLNVLTDSDYFVINPGVVGAKGNKAVVSAGTGLGEAGIFFDGKEDHPFAGEGGHCDFAPRDQFEMDLLQFLVQKYGHASYERVLSGMGIENIYDFLKTQGTEPGLDAEMEGKDRAKIISDKALEKSSKICVRTIEVFVSLYGSEAGNVALKFLASGGVYLGGGIAPKLLEFMKSKIFLKAFISKGRFEDLLCDIPVKVILNDQTSLLGATYYAKNCMK